MEKLLESMVALIATTPGRWIELFQALPVDQLVRAPVDGEWSAVECLQHLVDSESVYQFRVEAFLAGRDSFRTSTRIRRAPSQASRLRWRWLRSSPACAVRPCGC